jgi:hypothetical protein
VVWLWWWWWRRRRRRKRRRIFVEAHLGAEVATRTMV